MRTDTLFGLGSFNPQGADRCRSGKSLWCRSVPISAATISRFRHLTAPNGTQRHLSAPKAFFPSAPPANSVVMNSPSDLGIWDGRTPLRQAEGFSIFYLPSVSRIRNEKPSISRVLKGYQELIFHHSLWFSGFVLVVRYAVPTPFVYF